MKKIKLIKLGLILTFFCISVAQGKTLFKSVEVIGNQRVEKATILNYLDLPKGKSVSKKQMDSALKSLFNTDLFSDVKIDAQGDKLIVKVVENPVVAGVYFEGNKKLEDKALFTEIQTKERGVFTKAKIQADMEHLLEVYRRIGRFNTSVVPKIIKRDFNRVDVVFEINEGKPSYIRKIAFIGNHHFSAKKLKEQLMSKEEKWFRFFSSMDTYDPERFDYDKQMLRKFYMSHGYIDFKIKEAQVELAPDKTSFFITYEIEEGNQYTVSKVGVRVHIPGVEKKQLEGLVKVEVKKPYSSETIYKTIDAMTDFLGDKGFPFVDVSPQIKKNKSDVELTFLINEGAHVFVDKINISGNSRTLDKIIRREFTFSEGDAFNAAKFRKTKQKIENLGYFSKVDMDVAPLMGVKDKLDANLVVQEKSTGSFNLGIGWSTYDGMLFDIGLKERNLLGTGLIVGASASISENDIVYDLSFADPYFRDMPLLFGVNLFHVEHDYRDVSSYNWTTIGASFKFGWNWLEDLSQIVKYTLQEDKVTDVPTTASVLVQEQAGTTIVSSISQTLSYDKRDNRFYPTEGYVVSLSTDLAGFGGDVHYLRGQISLDKYYSFFDKNLILSLTSSVGAIGGIGEDVGIYNRFFMGGGNLRGFESSGIGAITITGEDALGGNWRALAGAELNFPLGLPDEVGLKGKVFIDTGILGKPDDFDKEEVYYSSRPRASVGFGLIWKSPMGPINIDWGFPIMKDKYDKKEVFRLNFGTGF